MTTESITQEGATPIGVQESGEVYNLSSQDRPGMLYVFGRTGQGKSVMLESLVISDIRNGRGGIFIDPYGDLAQEIQQNIAPEKAGSVVMFVGQQGTVEENIAKFHKEIDLVQIKGDAHKFLLCTLDYRVLGTKLASDIGREIVKQFLQVVGGEHRTIGIDEAHNIIDEALLESIIHAKENDVSYIFADQMIRFDTASMGERILKAVNHILCYFVDTETATSISAIHPELSVSALGLLEKYHFLAKLNVQTSSPTVVALKGMLPKDLPV